MGVGLSGCRTIGLSDRRTIGLSDYRAVGLSGCRTIGPSEYKAVTTAVYIYIIPKSKVLLICFINRYTFKQYDKRWSHLKKKQLSQSTVRFSPTIDLSLDTRTLLQDEYSRNTLKTIKWRKMVQYYHRVRINVFSILHYWEQKYQVEKWQFQHWYDIFKCDDCTVKPQRCFPCRWRITTSNQ